MSLPAETAPRPSVRPAPPARREMPNLARRPFTNSRPVTRVALLLWLLGFLLLLGNVSLFWSYLAGSGEKRNELAQIASEIEQRQRRNAQLEARLAGLALDQENEQVRFLNAKIAERAFSWSLLFDRLAQVLPDGVRLQSLGPSPLMGSDDTKRSAARQAPVEGRVQLRIHGEAKSDEALLQFVDNLFAHPFFEDPDLSRDTREETDLVDFDVQVTYLPEGRPRGPVAGGPAPQVREVTPAPPAAPPAAPSPRGRLEDE